MRSVAGLPAEAASEAKRASREGGSNSVVESQPSKLLVAGSIPVSRSSLRSLGSLRRGKLRHGKPVRRSRGERGLKAGVRQVAARVAADLSAEAARQRSELAAPKLRAADLSAEAASEASDERRPM